MLTFFRVANPFTFLVYKTGVSETVSKMKRILKADKGGMHSVWNLKS